MLEQVLMHLKNWFLVPGGIHEGTYTIEDGGIALPFLANGQYFRICGSVFNDGLHQYPASDLKAETFDGTVWALAIPQAVIELAAESRLPCHRASGCAVRCFGIRIAAKTL